MRTEITRRGRGSYITHYGSLSDLRHQEYMC